MRGIVGADALLEALGVNRRRSHDRPLAISMASGGDDLLSDEHGVADVAMGALGQAVGLTSCNDSCVDNGSVTICRNDGFGGSFTLAAGRAVGSARDAVGGAGGVHVLDVDPGMTGGLDSFCIGMGCVMLAGESLDTGLGASGFSGYDTLVPFMINCINVSYLLGTTTAASLGLFAYFGASGSFGDNPFAPSMAKRIDFFLRNKNLVADRTVLALGQARPSAVRSNSIIDDLGVALCGNNLLGDEHRIADTAVGALGQASGLAGCRDSGVGDGDVTVCGNDGPGGFLALAAGRAVGSARDAGLGAGGVLVLDLAISVVTVGGNNLLGFDCLATNRAMLAFGFTIRGAGGGNGLINDFGMASGGNGLDGRLVASGALLASGVAVFGAGRSLVFDINPIMIDGDSNDC